MTIAVTWWPPAPGGLWTKDVYDGADRLAYEYTTDGAGGTPWADAITAEYDTVLEQLMDLLDRFVGIENLTDEQKQCYQDWLKKVKNQLNGEQLLKDYGDLIYQPSGLAKKAIGDELKRVTRDLGAVGVDIAWIRWGISIAQEQLKKYQAELNKLK